MALQWILVGGAAWVATSKLKHPLTGAACMYRVFQYADGRCDLDGTSSELKLKKHEAKDTGYAFKMCQKYEDSLAGPEVKDLRPQEPEWAWAGTSYKSI